jgi:hypothetical protein
MNYFSTFQNYYIVKLKQLYLKLRKIIVILKNIAKFISNRLFKVIN